MPAYKFYIFFVLLWQLIAKSGALLHRHGDVWPYHIQYVVQASYSGSVIPFFFVRFPIGVFVEYYICWEILQFHLLVFRI